MKRRGRRRSPFCQWQRVLNTYVFVTLTLCEDNYMWSWFHSFFFQFLSMTVQQNILIPSSSSPHPCFLVWRGVSEIHTSGTSDFGGADAKSTPRSEGSPALQTLSGVLRQDSFRQETVIDLYRGLYNTVMWWQEHISLLGANQDLIKCGDVVVWLVFLFRVERQKHERRWAFGISRSKISRDWWVELEPSIGQHHLISSVWRSG